MSDPLAVAADPYPFRFVPDHTALLVIDMQRDFVEPGGFGETLGNDVSLLREVIPPLRAALAATREATGPTGPSTLLRRCTRSPTRLPILNGSHAWISEDGTGSAAPSTSTIMPLDQHG